MSVWSHRPQPLYLGLFFIAYVLGCGFAQALAIVPGITVSIWPPGGIFFATLALTSPYSWPWWMLAGCMAEMFAQFAWFHSPLPAGFLIYLGNALCAAVGATLVNRACGRSVRLESLREVIAFVTLGAGVGPLLSATVGSATLAWFGVKSQTFTAVWPLFWIGDATGILLVAPAALVVIQSWPSKNRLSAAQWAEAAVLGLIFLGIAALSLTDDYLPSPYIIMPPLLWVAVRFEFRGAAVALTLLALMTMALTISGDSQFVGDPGSQRQRQVMLQLFLAISAFSALIVAAISRQHQQALLALRQSVETLRERERELSQLVDMVPVQIRRLTPEGEPIFFNKRLLDFFGLDNLEQIDKSGTSRLAAAIQTFVHPKDADKLLRTVRHSLATGDPYIMKYRMRHADGTYRWVDGRGEALRDERGAIVQWFVISIDIEDEVRVQHALHESERQLRQLIDAVPALIWSTTPQGTPSYINKRLLDTVGVTLEDLIAPDASRSLADVYPEDRQAVEQALAHSFETGTAFAMKYRQHRSDGTYRWIEGRLEPLCDPDGRIVQWYGVCLDIDDRLQAEEALRNSKQQLEQMIDAVPITILSFAPSGKITYVSKRYLDQVGSPMAHIEDFETLARDVVHPEDFPSMFREASNGFATGRPFVNRFRRRDRHGSYRWIEARAQPLLDDDGAVVQWYVASIDIEDEMGAQEALRERERFLWQLVETLPAMIDCAAPDGEPVFRSQRLREFLGYELTELDGVGKTRLDGTLDAGVHPDDVAGVKKQYAHSLSTGEPYARRHRLRRFDGEYHWVETRAAAMRNAEGTIVQWNVICLDIDAEVRAQENLRLAQDSLARAGQAASLAELSASIAHEVNQPLSAVMNYSSACQRWLTAEPPNLERAQKALGRIIHSANSAADVVSRVRALFKRSLGTRDSTRLDGVIAEARDLMAEEALRRRVRMDAEVESDLRVAPFDHVQVQQVLVNLIRNGMDAMAAVSNDKVLRIHTRREEEAVRIEISDLGQGVQFPDRIFEPFFTTKEQGMGMGLAICRSIVEAHGGQLWAEKNEPQGATFVFTLPTETQSTRDAG
jgi:PAS domain S-box-containing protein